ncbi:MAG TPA: ester cyclase [Chthonomonadales bacterium]|nr:ester cyclase [Chthonomonadales bacterium]
MSEADTTLAKNRVLVRRIYNEALLQGMLGIVEEIFSPDFVDHSTPDQPTGPGGVRAYFEAIRHGVPDVRVVIDDIVGEGEKVVVRTSWRGTHMGSYEGVAPTGKVATRTLIQLFRIVDGVVVEEWNEGGGMLGSVLDSVQRDSL